MVEFYHGECGKVKIEVVLEGGEERWRELDYLGIQQQL